MNPRGNTSERVFGRILRKQRFYLKTQERFGTNRSAPVSVLRYSSECYTMSASLLTKGTNMSAPGSYNLTCKSEHSNLFRGNNKNNLRLVTLCSPIWLHKFQRYYSRKCLQWYNQQRNNNFCRNSQFEMNQKQGNLPKRNERYTNQRFERDTHRNSCHHNDRYRNIDKKLFLGNRLLGKKKLRLFMYDQKWHFMPSWWYRLYHIHWFA